jgi:diguanylate cyclase (GGDEF)-like protein
VRETDTVARIGGDEFVVLLTDVDAAGAVAAKVDQLLAALAEPLDEALGGVAMPACSIGVARYPDDGEDADTLMSHADAQMYRLKRQASSRNHV